jgi:hypothetical protein
MCVSCIHPYYAHTTPNAHPHHNTPTCTAKFINITPAATPKLQGVPYEPDAAILCSPVAQPCYESDMVVNAYMS